MKGTQIILGDTGKSADMNGKGEFIRTSLGGPAKGISAGMSKTTISWKIS